jgi:hypothetical protein
MMTAAWVELKLRHGWLTRITAICNEFSAQKVAVTALKIFRIIFHHGQRMSRVPCQTRGMKNRNLCGINRKSRVWPVPDEVIARFGTVNLARRADGGHALVGGTRHDQVAVKRWCRRFAPFVGFGGNPSNDSLILRGLFQR